MPSDSNGNFNLVASYFVELGDTSDPSQHNPVFEDIATGLTDRLMRDGRAPMTGDLNFDGNKATGLADGTAATDAATVQQGVPPGAVLGFPFTSAPTGWVAGNGQSLSRTTYARLWTSVQSGGNLAATEGAKTDAQFGPGDGSTTFTLPNYNKGYFFRGLNSGGSGLDPSRNIGTIQSSQNLEHDHTASTASAGSHTHTGSTQSAGSHTHSYVDGIVVAEGLSLQSGGGTTVTETGRTTGAAGTHTHTLDINAGGSHTHSVTVNDSGGSEARPHNIALLYCIKT